jgi:hypothetical protein
MRTKLNAMWVSVRATWVLGWRFVTRAFLDDTGSPSVAPFLVLVFTVWFMWWITKTSFGLGPMYRPPEPYVIQGVLALGGLLIIWAAALKLGVSIFVPVAEVIAQALGKLVSVGSTATEIVRERMKVVSEYDPPDRNVPLAQKELAQTADAAPGSQKVPDV